MQIIELYIKGYKRILGSAKVINANKLEDTTANFTDDARVGDLITNINTNEIASVTAIDSNTVLSLSDDIFTSLDVYRLESDYSRVDLFQDESVVITDSLLNVRDIGKVFTPFSQQFNLPASKNNNLLFKHYENPDIINGFDARFRHDAIIKLNGIDYKKGRIQFKSVSLKNNKAYAYKVVFFGETVELKEILGEAKLSSLNYGDLGFEYTGGNIRKLFYNSDFSIINDFGSLDILVPNIAHSKNMRLTNNGYKDDITDTILKYEDLKPAIKIRAIIEAINRTYTGQINLTGFLLSSQIENIYMWMHKNEGYITNAVEGGDRHITLNRFRHQEDVPLDYIHNNTNPSSFGDVRTLYLTNTEHYQRYKVEVVITVATGTVYDIRAFDTQTGNEYANYQNVENSSTTTFYIGSNTIAATLVDFSVEVTSDNNISMTQTLVITKQEREEVFGAYQTIFSAVYFAANSDVQNDFIVADQMPDMKVMDFLNGLFKMFNLVVFKEGNDIGTYRASWWMNQGQSYDITKYVDMETATMERLFQYKTMDFNFKSKKSFLVRLADKINGTPFAEESYGNNEWDGETYNVELPFEKMMYERLSNENTGVLSPIGQGAMIDDKFDPTIGEPLLLSIHLADDPDNLISIDGVTHTIYRRPSNLTDFSWGFTDRLALNFGEEIDEYLQEPPSNTTNLFKDGYFDYVESVFDINARMLKVSAYLPISILSKYNLRDKFIINNRSYRINSIKTNLLTNKTDLELYNKEEFVSQINNNQVAYLGRTAQVVESTKGTDFVTVSWDAVSGADGYEVILNGGTFSSVPNTTTTLKVTGLESNTYYNIDVRVKYIINGVNAFSFDVGITVKTN